MLYLLSYEGLKLRCGIISAFLSTLRSQRVFILAGLGGHPALLIAVHTITVNFGTLNNLTPLMLHSNLRARTLVTILDVTFQACNLSKSVDASLLQHLYGGYILYDDIPHSRGGFSMVIGLIDFFGQLALNL